jgi:hypothetical protein
VLSEEKRFIPLKGSSFSHKSIAFSRLRVFHISLEGFSLIFP